MKQVTLLLGFSSLCFQSKRQEQAGREAASGGVEQMSGLAATGGLAVLWGAKADVPLSGGECRHLWEEGMFRGFCPVRVPQSLPKTR